MTRDEIIKRIKELPEDEIDCLSKVFGVCNKCGAPIVRNNGCRKYCPKCAMKVARDKRNAWQMDMYKSTHYQHDKYISGKQW